MQAPKLSHTIRPIFVLVILLLTSACGGLEGDSDGTLTTVGSSPVLPGTEPDGGNPPPAEEPTPAPQPTPNPDPSPIPPAPDSNVSTLMVSIVPDRSGAVELQNQSLTGLSYIFVTPESGVRQVRFYLDDPARATPFRIENVAPFDLAGTGSGGNAAPFDASALDPSTAHTISAEIEGTDGNVEVVTASFDVVSPSVEPPPAPAPTPAPSPEPSPAPEPEPLPEPDPAPAVTPSLSAGDALAFEGDTGTTTARLTLSLSEPSDNTVSVDWSTSAVTAMSGSDFVADQGTATFSPGSTTQVVTVQILGDRIDEPDETFRVNLRNATNATLDTGSAIVTIEDDDAQPTITVFGTGVTEGQSGTTPARFSVALSDATGLDVTVDYYTIDGTATRDQDFEFSQGTLTIPAGEVVGTISVPVLGDTIEEGEESFELLLENASNATITTSSALGIIEDDDTTRSATLTWKAPVTNVDDSCNDDLAGYRINAGTETGTYTRTEQVSLSSGDLTCEQTGFDASCGVPVETCTYVMPGLTPGTWFFSVQAYDLSMNYSPYSTEASADIQ